MSDAGGSGRRALLVPAGRIAGVPFVVSPWWFVAAVAFTILYAPSLQAEVSLSDPAAYAIAALLVLIVYAGVLVHEASHVLVAKALGLPVGRVVLQLLGGVSEILEEPASADREFLVAAVGPLTSVLLVGVSAAFLPLVSPHTVPWVIVWGALTSNAAIAIFNSLPGLPLDGGRVARAAIWQITHNKARATIVAGWIGRGVAVALFLTGLWAPAQVFGRGSFGGLYFLLIAFFMWSNASMAIAQAKVSEVVPGIAAGSLLRKAMPVEAQLPVAEAIRRARLADARALVIVDGNGKPQGLVSEAAVMQLPEQRRPWVSISEVSHPLSKSLILRDDLTGEALMNALRGAPATEYLVVAASGAIRGVLARADVGAALRAAGVR
jgi:Zn-dependent protease/CBS domain-containing protein